MKKISVVYYYLITIGASVYLLIEGTKFIAEFILPIFVNSSGWVFISLLVIALPLSFIFRTMRVSAFLFSCSFYYWMAYVWLLSFFICLDYIGTWSVVAGLIFGGFGVVPVALIGCIYYGQWTAFLWMLGYIALIYASSGYSSYLGNTHDKIMSEINKYRATVLENS